MRIVFVRLLSYRNSIYSNSIFYIEGVVLLIVFSLLDYAWLRHGRMCWRFPLEGAIQGIFCSSNQIWHINIFCCRNQFVVVANIFLYFWNIKVLMLNLVTKHVICVPWVGACHVACPLKQVVSGVGVVERGGGVGWGGRWDGVASPVTEHRFIFQSTSCYSWSYAYSMHFPIYLSYFIILHRPDDKLRRKRGIRQVWSFSLLVCAWRPYWCVNMIRYVRSMIVKKHTRNRHGG